MSFYVFSETPFTQKLCHKLFPVKVFAFLKILNTFVSDDENERIPPSPPLPPGPVGNSYAYTHTVGLPGPGRPFL
jgi:hypothetical protein